MKDTGINTFSGKPRWDWSKPKSSKSEALRKSANAGTGRRLTAEESREKTRNWPKSGSKGVGGFPESEKEKKHYQERFKRASNE